MHLDFGVETIYNLTVREKGRSEISTGQVVESKYGWETIRFDFRPRLQLSGQLDRQTMFLNVSHGLNSHTKRISLEDNCTYSFLMRGGINYQVNHPQRKPRGFQRKKVYGNS
jgi:hypothetical protein